MATCATDNMEGLVLVYERVCFGSLFNYLHEKVSAACLVLVYIQWNSGSYLVPDSTSSQLLTASSRLVYRCARV